MTLTVMAGVPGRNLNDNVVTTATVVCALPNKRWEGSFKFEVQHLTVGNIVCRMCISRKSLLKRRS